MPETPWVILGSVAAIISAASAVIALFRPWKKPSSARNQSQSAKAGSRSTVQQQPAGRDINNADPVVTEKVFEHHADIASLKADVSALKAPRETLRGPGQDPGKSSSAIRPHPHDKVIQTQDHVDTGKSKPDVGKVSNVEPVAVSPSTVNSFARYRIIATLGPEAGNAIKEDIGQFMVTFPAGTVVPARIPGSAILVNGIPASSTGTNSVPPEPPVVFGRVVTITSPVSIAASAQVEVVFTVMAGLLNPALSRVYTLSLATAQNQLPQVDLTTAPYPIFASLAVCPTSGTRGTGFTLTGSGYRSSTSIDILFSDTLIASGTIDTSGNFSITASVPPRASLGTNKITAKDGAGTSSPGVLFVVHPSLTLGQSSGLAGSTVTITGSNWPANEAIFVSVAGAPKVQVGLGDPKTANAITTANGVMPNILGGQPANAVFRIPPGLTPGVKTVEVTVDKWTLTAKFEVTAPA